MASNVNDGRKEGVTTTPDKKPKGWSNKLSLPTRLSPVRSRKPSNEPKISTNLLGPDTPPDTDANTARHSIDESVSPTTPGVDARRQQLIQSRLDSVSPDSIRRFNDEFVSEFDDDLASGHRNTKDDNAERFKSLDPCLHRTWAMLSFCVLEPAKCLIRPICNDKQQQQQPGQGKANDNHAAGDGELRWRQRRSLAQHWDSDNRLASDLTI